MSTQNEKLYFKFPSEKSYGLTASAAEPDPGYIHFPEKISATNIVMDYQKQGKTLPAASNEYLKEYDFHLMTFNAVVESVEGKKGVSKFRVASSLQGGNGTDVTADDAGPETNWVVGPSSANVDFKIRPRGDWWPLEDGADCWLGSWFGCFRKCGI